MRDIFTPVFITVLAALFLVDALDSVPSVLTVSAAAVFVLFLGLSRFRRYRTAYGSMVLALALLFSGSYVKQKQAFESKRDSDLPVGEYISICGTLAAYPEIGNDGSRLLLRTRSFSWQGRTIDRSLNVSVLVAGDCRQLNRGDRVELAARIQPRQLSTNFVPNPYEKYLLYRQLHLSAFSKSTQLVQVTARAHLLWRLLGAWRESIRKAIEGRYLQDGRLRAAGVFLEATVLGDRGRLETETREELIQSGVFHLLAISGANIGMLALFSLFLCRWLRVPLKARYAFTALLLLIFLALSGFDISARRAVLMGCLLFVARVYFLDVALSNIISFCGLLLLAFAPARFLDPGFILTFALTAALLVGRRLLLPVLKRLPRFAAELLTANFSASVLALPLSLYFFQRFSFSGFVSGLLLVPLTGAVTVCGALLLPLALLPFNAACLALLPAGFLLDIFFAVAGWFSDHFALNIFRPAPALPLVFLAALLFYSLALEKIRGRAMLAPSLMLFFILLLISLPPGVYRPGRLEAYFLDVGHGDAQAVVFPCGDALLIDGGGAGFSDFQVGRRLVLPFILQQRIRVRWAAVSHCHPDHAKGMAEIIAILVPEELWLSAAAAGDDYYRQLLAAKPKKTRIREIAQGFVKKIGNCSVACLFPPRFIEAETAGNDQSMVLRISDGRTAFLFSGDIEKSGESDLVDRCGQGLVAPVLKIAHHGSRTSSSTLFLDAVKPRLAVISVAAASSYGFPHPDVVTRLKQRRVRWLSTARSGGILVTSADDGLRIEVSK